MNSFHFVITNHPRLAFNDAEKRVLEFVTRRLKAAGVGSVTGCKDLAAGRDAAEEMSQTLNTGHVFLVDAMNPIVDLELARSMAAAMSRTGAAKAECDGAIPGTQIEVGYSAKAARELKTQTVKVQWPTQARYNNQFNLYKYKRVKMFLALLDMVPDLHTQTVEQVVSTLEGSAVFNRLAAFAEDVPLVEYASCPHCAGRLTALPLNMSQPFCGYLPASRPLYFECEGCGLVIATPVLCETDLPDIYDQWDRQDFVATLNNPYHAGATRCDFGAILKFLPEKARTLDLGGGMGRFSQYLKKTYPQWEVTHSDFAIKRNPELESLGIHTRTLNFLEEPIAEGAYDLITAWEVIEHAPYERFSGVIESIHRALAPGGLFVFSTPDFDSPLCKSMDFYGLCPPFHYLVFGRKWLERYFAETSGWEVIEARSCSDFLDDALMWYAYGAKTAPTMQLRATSEVLRAIFADDADGKLRRGLLKQGIGTEIIIALRKRNSASVVRA